MVPENLFVYETSLQLITFSKDLSEEIPKLVTLDVLESISKSFESPLVIEVLVFIDESPKTYSINIDEDTISKTSTP